VDDVNSTLMTRTPATGLSAYVALAQSCTAPNAAGHGTGVSFAGSSPAQAVLVDVRTIDLPGSPPRGAPV
jgi:hypothetical protein